MKTKRILLSTILICFCLSARAQSNEDKWWFLAAYNNNQYGSIISAPFDDLLRLDAVSFTLGVDRYLSKSFDAKGTISLGKVMSKGEERANLLGFQLTPKYKFYNGNVLPESSRFQPYLAMGIGFINITESQNTTVDEEGTFLTFSPEIGIGYQFTERFKLWASTAFKINGDFRYREYSVGASFSLAKKVDSDGDGVSDKKDLCPNEAGSKESKGCPPDRISTDPPETKDPVRQPVEQRDTTSTQTQPVEKSEEPVQRTDRDGDGVPDILDACPDEAGTVENNGCKAVEKVETAQPQTTPTPQGPVYNLPTEAVAFVPGTNRIVNADQALLDQLAALMRQDESFKLELNGYGDRGSDASVNFELARRRVAAVRTYLVSKGISQYRFILNALGSPREAGTSGKVMIKVIN